MTHPQLTPLNEGGGDYLDIRARQGQLMVVRVWDVAQEVITANNPDGWVYPRDKTKEPFPNSVVRAAIVDLGINGTDGLPGKVYPEAWIQASSIMKEAKKWKGQLKLVLWKQKDPTDKSSLYDIFDMSGDQNAVAVYQDFVTRHPEFFDLTAPEPYEPRRREQRQPPAPQQPQYQQPYGQPQPGWNSQPPQQWQPPVPPAQPPSQWNTAAPPPEYYTQQPPQYPQPGYNAPQIQGYMNQMPPQQPDPWAQPMQQWAQQSQNPQPTQAQQGPYGGAPQQQGPYGQPPQQQAPQGAPGSFFQASQGQPAPQIPGTPQWQGGFNQQSSEPPF